MLTNHWIRAVPMCLVVSMLAIAGCTTPATEVLVTVDTDARSRVQSMRAIVSLGDQPSQHPNEHPWGGADAGRAPVLPGSFAVHPGEAANDSFVTLQVELVFAPAVRGEPVVTLRRTARFRFTPHTATSIRLFFPLTCAAAVAPPARCRTTTVPCTVARYCEELTPSQTCGDNGQCTGVDITPLPIDLDASSPIDARPVTDVRTEIIHATDVRVATDSGPVRDAPDACVCPMGSHCDAMGRCVCTPVCAGRNCGGDSCGSICGTCGTGLACNAFAGQCFACTEGEPCETGDPCTTGSVSCGAGSPQCEVTGSAPVDTPCASGRCNASGTCVCTRRSCRDLTLCDPSPANVGATSLQADGCGGSITCGPCCSMGSFCGGGQMVDYKCNCGNPPDARPGWVDQGTNCWHRVQDGPVPC